MALETKGNTQIAGVNSSAPATPKDPLVDTVNQLARLNIRRDTSRLTSGREMSGGTYQYNRDTVYHDAASKAGLKLDPLMNHQWDAQLKDTQSEWDVFSNAFAGFWSGAAAGALDSLGSNDPHEIGKLFAGASDTDGYGSGNFLMRWADQIQDYSARHHHIFTTDEDDSIFDATYWANQAQTLGYTAGIALETLGEQALLSVLSGATGGSTAAVQAASALKSATKLGRALSMLGKGGKNIAKFLGKSAVFGIYSGAKETYLNSLEVQDQVYNEFKTRGYSDEEAMKYAAEAAAENMRLEFGPVAALNAMQFGLLGKLGRAKVNPFNVASKAQFSFGTSDFVSNLAEKVLPLDKIGNKYLRKAANLGVQAFSESIEEGWQEGTSMYLKEKKLRERGEFTGLTMNEAIFNTHLEDAMIAGAFGGAVMSVGHKAIKKSVDFFNRDAIAREAKEKQDTLDGIKNSFQRMNESLNNATDLSEEHTKSLRSNINFNNVAHALQFDYRHQTTDGFDSYMAMLEQAERAVENGNKEVLADLGLEGYTKEDIQELKEGAIKAKESFVEEYHNTDDDFSIAFAQMKRKAGIANLQRSSSILETKLKELEATNGYEALTPEEKEAYKTLHELTELSKGSTREKVHEYMNRPEVQEAIGSLIENENLKRVEEGKPELTAEEQKSIRDKYILGNIKDSDLEFSEETKNKIKELSDKYDDFIEEKNVSNSRMEELLDSNIIETRRMLDNTKKELDKVSKEYSDFRDKKYQRKWREQQIQKQREEYEKKIAEINSNPNLSKKEKKQAIREVLGQKESLMQRMRNWVDNIRKKDDPVQSTNEESARAQQEAAPTVEQKQAEARRKRNPNPNKVNINDILEMQKSHQITRDSEFYYITIPESDTPIPYSRVHSILPPQYNKKSVSFEAVLAEIEASNYDPEVINKWLKSQFVDTIIQQESYTEEERDKAIAAIKANMEHFLTMGNAVDTIVRDIFQDKTPQKPEGVEQEVFESIVKEANKLKADLAAQGLRGVTESIILWHTFPDGTKVAGEVDMLVVDAEGNVVGVLDIKTSKWGYNHEMFTSTKGGKNISTKEYYTYQLSTYADLLEGQYGIVVNDLRLAVFKLEGKAGVITSVDEMTLSENIPYKHNPNLPEIQQEEVIPEVQEVIDILNSEESNEDVADMHTDEYISYLQKISPFPSEFNSAVKSVVISAVNVYGKDVKNYIRVSVNKEGQLVVHANYTAHTGIDGKGNVFSERILVRNDEQESPLSRHQMVFLNNPYMPGTFNSKTVPVIKEMIELAEDGFIDTTVQQIEVEIAHQEAVDEALKELHIAGKEMTFFREHLDIDESVMSNEVLHKQLTAFFNNNKDLSIENFEYVPWEPVIYLKSPKSYITGDYFGVEQLKITFDGNNIVADLLLNVGDSISHYGNTELSSIHIFRDVPENNENSKESPAEIDAIAEAVKDILGNTTIFYYDNPNLINFENYLVDPTVANTTYEFIQSLIEDFHKHRTDAFTWVNLFKHLNTVNKDLFNQFRRKDKFGMLMSHYKYAMHINGMDISMLTPSTIEEIYNAVYLGELREHIKDTGMSVSEALNKMIAESSTGTPSTPSVDVSGGSNMPSRPANRSRRITASYANKTHTASTVVVFGTTNANTELNKEVEKALLPSGLPVNSELSIEVVDLNNPASIPEALKSYVETTMQKLLAEGNALEDVRPIIFRDKDGNFIGVMPNYYKNSKDENATSIQERRKKIIAHYEQSSEVLKVTVLAKDNGRYQVYKDSDRLDFSTLKTIKELLDETPNLSLDIGFLQRDSSMGSVFVSDNNRLLTTEEGVGFVFDYPVGNAPSGKPALRVTDVSDENKLLELQTAPLSQEDINIIIGLIRDSQSDPKALKNLSFNISKFIHVPQSGSTNTSYHIYEIKKGKDREVYFEDVLITEAIKDPAKLNRLIEHLQKRKFYFDAAKYYSEGSKTVEMPVIKNGRIYTYKTGLTYREYANSRMGTNVVIRPIKNGRYIDPLIYPNPTLNISEVIIPESAVPVSNPTSLSEQAEAQTNVVTQTAEEAVVIQAQVEELQVGGGGTVTNLASSDPFAFMGGSLFDDFAPTDPSDPPGPNHSMLEPPISNRKIGEKGIAEARKAASTELEGILNDLSGSLPSAELEHIKATFTANVANIKEISHVRAYLEDTKAYIHSLQNSIEDTNKALQQESEMPSILDGLLGGDSTWEDESIIVSSRPAVKVEGAEEGITNASEVLSSSSIAKDEIHEGFTVGTKTPTLAGGIPVTQGSSAPVTSSPNIASHAVLERVNGIMRELLSHINMSWSSDKNIHENSMLLMAAVINGSNYPNTTVPYNFFVEFEKIGFDWINAYVENGDSKTTALDALKKEFQEYIKRYKEATNNAIEDIKEITTPEQHTQLVQAIEEIQKRLEASITDKDNWKKLVKAIQYKLNAISNNRYDIVENTEEAFEDEYGFDESEEHHAKFSLSKEVRQFLSGIHMQKRNSEGINVTLQGFLGMPVYMDYSEVFNIVQSILTYPSPVRSSYNHIIDRLRENKNRYPFLSTVIAKLNSVPKQLKNQFVYAMTQVHNTPIKATKEGIIYANSREAYIRIGNEIKSEAQLSLLLEDGNPDNNLIASFLTGYEAIKSQMKEGMDTEEIWKVSEELSNLLATIGIYVDSETLFSISEKELKISRHTETNTVPFRKLLTESSSPFVNIRQGLDKVQTGNISVKDFISGYLEGKTIYPLINLMVTQDEGSYSKTYRDSGKIVSSVVSPRYANDAVELLKDADYRATLSKDVMTTNNLWLSAANIDDIRSLMEFNVFAVGAYTETPGRYTELSVADRMAIDYKLYTETIKVEALGRMMYAIGYRNLNLTMRRMPFPALSDKSQMYTLRVPTLDLSQWSMQDTILNPNSKKRQELFAYLTDAIFLPELLRIEKYLSNPEAYNVDGHSKTFGIFHQVPALNALKLDINGTTENILDYVHSLNENGSAQKVSDLLSGNDVLKEQIGEFLFRNIIGLSHETSNQPLSAEMLGSVMQLPPNGVDIERSKYELYSIERKLNYTLSNVFLHSAISGDAAYYVRDKDIRNNKIFTDRGSLTPEALLEENMANTIYELNRMVIINGGTNMGKRMSLLSAQGHKLAESDSSNSNDSHYLQIFLEDFSKSSTSMRFHISAVYPNAMQNKATKKAINDNLKKLNDKDPAKVKEAKNYFYENFPIVAPYLDNAATDAQEYTTAKEHVDILFRQGKLDGEFYKKIVKKLEAYTDKELSGKPITEDDLLTREEISKVMQPLKPVYTGLVDDTNSGSMRPMYIKSSSFPLIPQLTKGLELDKMRRFMESAQKKTGKNVRASYQSANKVGAVNKPIRIWNSDNTFNEEVFGLLDDMTSFKKNHTYTLPRTHFKIQLEVPYKDKDVISIGTQLQKLLFGDGVIDLKDIVHAGKKYTGKELQEKYLEVFSGLIENRKRRLYIKLGIDSNGEISNPKRAFNKLREILISEARKKGWSPSEIHLISSKMSPKDFKKGASLFNTPLFVLPNAESIETLLMSFINNELYSLKMPGYSFVAASEAGYKVTDDKNIDENILNKIVYTKHFKGHLKAAEFHVTNGKVDGLKSAQVFLPAKFRDKDGKLIEFIDSKGNPNETYVEKDEKTGMLRLKDNMVDNEMLTGVTFRTPTSSHISTASITIAGFLPPEAGDIIVLPSNFTTQKGLDFDIDKENLYGLFSYVDPKTNQIRAYKADPNLKVEEVLTSEPEEKYFEVSTAGDELGKKFSALKATITADDKGFIIIKDISDAPFTEILINVGTKTSKDEKGNFITVGNTVSIEDLYQNLKVKPVESIENGIATVDLTSRKNFKTGKSKAPVENSVLWMGDKGKRATDTEKQDYSYKTVYYPLWEIAVGNKGYKSNISNEDYTALGYKVYREGYKLQDSFANGTRVNQARALSDLLDKSWKSSSYDIRPGEIYSYNNNPYGRNLENVLRNPKYSPVNYSGGASGADLMFYEESKTFPIAQEQYLFGNTQYDESYKIDARHVKQILDANDIKEAEKLYEESTGRILDPSSNFYTGMLRNMHVARKADAIYAVAPMKSSTEVYGGTNYAVQAAIKLNKAVFVFNGTFNDKKDKEGKVVDRNNPFRTEHQGKWLYYDYDENAFLPYDGVPPMYEKFAGIGSREADTLENKLAIQELFKTNFYEENTINREVLFKPGTREVEEAVNMDRIDKIEKSLSNEFVRITRSVLSSPILEIQAKMSKTLNMDFAKEQAEKLSAHPIQFTSLGEREYQQHKISLGAVGKFGIGVYSSAVTLNSLIQQAYSQDHDSTKMAVTITSDGKKIPVDFSFEIGGSTFNTNDSIGSSVKTRDGRRTVAEVLAERQNTATDNEKEQIMGRLNVNEFTIGADVMLTLLGFDQYNNKANPSDPDDYYSIPYTILRSLYVQRASDLYTKYGHTKEKAFVSMQSDINSLIHAINTAPERDLNYSDIDMLSKLGENLSGEGIANIKLDMNVLIAGVKKIINSGEGSLSQAEKIEQAKAAAIFMYADLMNQNILSHQSYINAQKNRLGMTFEDGAKQFRSQELLGKSGSSFHNNFLAKRAMSDIFLGASKEPFEYLRGQFLSDITLGYTNPSTKSYKKLDYATSKDYILTVSTLEKARDKFSINFLDLITNKSKSMPRLVNSIKRNRKLPAYIKDNMFFKRLKASPNDDTKLIINFDNSDASEGSLLISEMNRLYLDDSTVLIENYYGKPLTPKLLIELIGYTSFIGKGVQFGNLQRLLPPTLVAEIYDGVDQEYISRIKKGLNSETYAKFDYGKYRTLVVFNRFKGYNLLQALGTYNSNSNPPYRKLLEEAIRSIKETVTVDSVFGDKLQGTYNKGTNSITIQDSGNDNDTTKVLLHEAVHAMTVKYIEANDNSPDVQELGDLTSYLQGMTLETFANMYKKYNEDILVQLDENSIKEVILNAFNKMKMASAKMEELVAYAVSDREVMGILNALDAYTSITSNRSIIQIIAEFLMKILDKTGIKVREGSVLEQVLPRAWNIIGEGTSLFDTYRVQGSVNLSNLEEALISESVPSTLVRAVALQNSNPGSEMRVQIPSSIRPEVAERLLGAVTPQRYLPRFTHDSDNVITSIPMLEVNLPEGIYERLKLELGDEVFNHPLIDIRRIEQTKCQ